jgi:hypothetical protein
MNGQESRMWRDALPLFWQTSTWSRRCTAPVPRGRRHKGKEGKKGKKEEVK